VHEAELPVISEDIVAGNRASDIVPDVIIAPEMAERVDPVWVCELLLTEALITMLFEPSKATAVAVMSPVMSIVLAVANLVAVAALPEVVA
tara:strand:+ start:356 stop:628 length:273 start_codon:yes stop_codon:yes gene_type:complete